MGHLVGKDVYYDLGRKVDRLHVLASFNQTFYPETTFQHVILQGLEQGTLKNRLFDNSQSRTQQYMGHMVGAFLRLSAVKKALMSDVLRSTLLAALGSGIRVQSRGYLHEL